MRGQWHIWIDGFFLMMKEFGFVYDSSIPAPLTDPPMWPYTLDYKIPHKCIGDRKCPSRDVINKGQPHCRNLC